MKNDVTDNGRNGIRSREGRKSPMPHESAPD